MKKNGNVDVVLTTKLYNVLEKRIFGLLLVGFYEIQRAKLNVFLSLAKIYKRNCGKKASQVIQKWSKLQHFGNIKLKSAKALTEFRVISSVYTINSACEG